MIDFGNKLKSLRTEKHLTQQQVADRIGVTKSMISTYELSSRQPSYEVLIKLSSLFDVSTDYLLGIEKSRFISIAGLSDRQMELLSNMVDEFKNINKRYYPLTRGNFYVII